ncbi:MAG: DUF1585 domain-containing protein, partial [Myxococcales bacterium]
QGRVVACNNPGAPVQGAAFSRLERCTLGYTQVGTNRYGILPGCVQRDGYRLRAPPYWDASGKTEVSVCAFESQERELNPITLETCESSRFANDRTCGCGDRMRRCEPQNNAVFNARVRAVNEEPVLIADSVLRRDEPYFNLLTTRRSFVNGVLSSLWKQRQLNNVWAMTPPADLESIPSIDYAGNENTWKEYVRSEQHSGVLTTQSFLLRFPTQRARVNEFYEAFLCKTFMPPSNATLPDAEDSCNRENNLARRCGCNYCHATLEPTGAHWGRFTERGAAYIDPVRYPKLNPKCRDCALSGNTNCGGECREYIMSALDGDGAQSLGMLKPYLYRTAAEELNIVQGPRLLVERMKQTGDLERCTVRRMWKEFLGRGMTEQEQAMYLESLTRSFASSNFNLKKLIEEIVATDAYRRLD